MVRPRRVKLLITNQQLQPEFPAFNPMRIIRNDIVDEWQNRVDEIPKDRSNMKAIGHTVFAGLDKIAKPFDSLISVPETTGDFDQMPMLAGQGVSLVNSIEPAGQVISDIMHEAALAIGGLALVKASP